MSSSRQPFQDFVVTRPLTAILPFRSSPVLPKTPVKDDSVTNDQHGTRNEFNNHTALVLATPMVTATEFSQSSPPTEMKYFSYFPLEVRQDIYYLASSNPRVIHITGYLKYSAKSKANELRLSSNTLVPAIMHACVDSRNAGKRIYKALTLNKFTGTYVNWAVDYIMFAKSLTGRSVEDIYMTYESRIPLAMPHLDLVLNLQRLAVSPYHLNDFIRVTSDPLGNIEEQAPGLVLIYPNLKEIAVVECWKSAETKTQNMGIQPKNLIPNEPPCYFCPQTNLEPTAEGEIIVLNRWHQPCSWMRVFPQGGKLLTIKPKPKPEYAQPKAPQRSLGFSRLSVAKLRGICNERSLDQTGTRQTLIGRLRVDEGIRFSVAQSHYKQELRKWAGIMLGHGDPFPGTEFSDDVKAARAKAVTQWLADKGLETGGPTV